MVQACAAAAVLSIAAASALSAAVGLAPVAAAVPARQAPAGGYTELFVPSAMGPIKVQVQWARRGGNAALYLLDGMRARNDRNGWELETNARQQFGNDNITLIMPVGGQASFYTDWYAPSNLNGQKVTYKWETFLTRELPAFLAKYGVSPNNNAVIGLSMGGGAALALAAYHHEQFKFAGSISGFLNISAPGMREAIRVAMLDAGRFNVDAMWGPPWSGAWLRNDPFVFASKLRGVSLFIACGNGVPGASDRLNSPLGAFNAFTGIGLEVLAMVNTKAFQIKLTDVGVPATYDLSWSGTHQWAYWESELFKARNQILDVMNAR